MAKIAPLVFAIESPVELDDTELLQGLGKFVSFSRSSLFGEGAESVARVPNALASEHRAIVLSKIQEAVAAKQKAVDEAPADAPVEVPGNVLPIVLVDVLNHADDIQFLDAAGVKLVSIFTVRPHGPQTTRKKGAKPADPKKPAAPASAVNLDAVDVGPYAALVLDVNTGVRVPARPLVSVSLGALRRAGVPLAQQIVVEQIKPNNSNAGADTFSADLCAEISPLIDSRLSEWIEFEAWRARVPLSHATLAAPAAVDTPATSALYTKLMDVLPDECVSVPLALHCMFEQVEFNIELEAELASQAEHQRALAAAQAVAAEPVVEASAEAPADAAAPTESAPAVESAPQPEPEVFVAPSIATLSASELDAHVQRHYRLLAQLSDDGDYKPSTASHTASTVVYAHGDAVCGRRSQAVLSASPAAESLPPALFDWLREGEQQLLSLLPLPALPFPSDASSETERSTARTALCAQSKLGAAQLDDSLLCADFEQLLLHFPSADDAASNGAGGAAASAVIGENYPVITPQGTPGAAFASGQEAATRAAEKVAADVAAKKEDAEVGDGEIRSADGKRVKDWKVRERRFVEEMTPDTLRQVLVDAVSVPDIQAAHKYDSARQASLLVLHRPTPLSRQKAHTWSMRACPDLPFSLWRLARDRPTVQSAAQRVPLPAPASAWPQVPAPPVKPKPAVVEGEAPPSEEMDDIQVVQLETWNKVAADALSSGVGSGMVWDSLGSFSELSKWSYPSDRALLGCTLREASGDGRATVTSLVASDEALVAMHAGDAQQARLPLPPLPKAAPALNEWPDSAANERKRKEEAELLKNTPPVQFTPPAMQPAVITSSFPDQAVAVCSLDELHRGVRVQYTLPSGLVSSVAPDGTFTFRRQCGAAHQLDPDEDFRAVLSCHEHPEAAGAVVVHMRDGRRRMLLPDGNTSVRDAEGHTVVTKQSGQRVLLRADGSVGTLSALPVATQIDPETRARVTTRADMSILIVYPNGASLAQFADGTRIHRDVEEGEGFPAPPPNSVAARRLQPWPTDAKLPTKFRQVRVEAPGIPMVRIRAPDSDADIVAVLTRSKLWTAECRLPDRSALRWVNTPRHGGGALELDRICGLRLMGFPSGHALIAGRRCGPMPEPLRIRSDMPATAAPPGCFWFDLGLGAIYGAARDAEAKAIAAAERKRQAALLAEQQANAEQPAEADPAAAAAAAAAATAAAASVQVPVAPSYAIPSVRVVDHEGNGVCSDLHGRVETILARDSFNVVSIEFNGAGAVSGTPQADGDGTGTGAASDYVPPQYYAPQNDPLPPRLFLLRRDGSGAEYIGEGELADYRSRLTRLSEADAEIDPETAGADVVQLEPQPLVAPSDALPVGTQSVQLLVRLAAPRPYSRRLSERAAPAVVRAFLGQPSLGCGLGVPMRSEVAARWLSLQALTAREQHWQLRNLLLLPALDLSTQGQAVADRQSYAQWVASQEAKENLYATEDSRTPDEREASERLPKAAVADRAQRRAQEAAHLKQQAAASLGSSTQTASTDSNTKTGGAGTISSTDARLKQPPRGTQLVPPLGPGSVGKTLDHPLPQNTQDKPKLRTQAADAKETTATGYFSTATGAHAHLSLTQQIRSVCFPSSPLTDAVESTKLGLSVRLPAATQLLADRDTALDVIQRLSDLTSAILPAAMSAAASGVAPQASSVVRRLDLKQPPLRDCLQNASNSFTNSMQGILSALGYQVQGAAGTPAGGIFLLQADDLVFQHTIVALRTDLARVRQALSAAAEFVEFPASLPALAPDSSDDEADYNDFPSPTNQVSPKRAAPASPTDGFFDEGSNEHEFYRAPVSFSAHQPHLPAAHTGHSPQRSQLQAHLDAARTQQQAQQQQRQTLTMSRKLGATVSAPGAGAEHLTAAAQAHAARVSGSALSTGVSQRSHLLDVYGKVREPRAMSVLQAAGNAAAEPNVSYIGVEAETKVAHRSKTSSTASIERLSRTQPISHESVLAGTSLQAGIIEATPVLADTLSPEAISAAQVAFAEFRLSPAIADFGRIQLGATYRMALQLTNCGHDKGRFQIATPPANSPMGLRVLYKPGPVVPGFNVRIELELFAGAQGPWRYDLQLTSERSVFKLPITAMVSGGSVDMPSTSQQSVMMNASAAAGKLGVPRIVALAPSAHVQAAFARMHMPIPAYGSGEVAPRASSAAANPHAISSALDDMDDDTDQQLQRELSSALAGQAVEPTLPDLSQKPFVDPKMSLEQLQKVAGAVPPTQAKLSK